MADRLPAELRRVSIIDAAIATFSNGAYGSTTTAQLGKAAGVAETIIFRHFGSKVGLYIACIDAVWERVRTACDEAMEAASDDSEAWAVLGTTFLGLNQEQPQLARLWAQSLVERTGVAQIDEHLEKMMRAVHDYITDIVTISQIAGGVLPGRKPRAEAWLIIAIGILGTIGQRLGDLVVQDLADVRAGRREWLTGFAGS